MTAHMAMPHCVEAEQALLGVLLYDNNAYFKTFEVAQADDFYDPVHARIYEAIGKTIDAGRVADVRTMHLAMGQDAGLRAQGGAQYLADLVASVIATSNAQDYARHIHALAMRRRLIVFADEMQVFARDQDAPPADGDDVIGRAEERLYKLSERRSVGEAAGLNVACGEAMARVDDAMRGGAKAVGLRTGLSGLDEKLGGLKPGNLITIAGRPSMGKTAIGITIAANAAMAGARVVFHSMEMDRADIAARLLARMTGISATKQTGDIGQDDYLRLFNARREIDQWPLFIDDGSRLTIGQVRGRAIRHKMRRGMDLLVIDYLGLMAATDPRMNRTYQIEEITTGLKALAKELKIPVLLLAQLNRQVEQREDKRPQLSDLRDSGAVEQDSDAVMFVFRNEYYLVRSEPRRSPNESDEKFNDRYDRWRAEVDRSRGKAELILDKNRHGERGSIPLRFEGWRCLFRDDGGEDVG